MATHRTAHLSWIRQPIAKSVELAKAAIESYFDKRTAAANPPPGAQPVWVTNKASEANLAFEEMAVLIAQIHAALIIVDSPGGVALSQELQIVCSNIRQGIIVLEDQHRALVAVQNGLLMLPGYLTMVIKGAPDSPGILVKYINEIREIRNVPLMPADSPLPTSASFAYQKPPHQKSSVDDVNRESVVKASSALFQHSFGEYLSSQSKDSLSRMRKALRDLQEVTHDVEVGCAWWIGECLLEAIAAGGVRNSSAATQTNIRVLSVAIQKFARDSNEGDAKAALGLERFRGLLYALSITTKSSPEIEQALEAFGVSKSVATEALKALQQRLAATHAVTLDDVVPELKPQLEAAMVSFGRALSTKTQAGFTVQMESYSDAMKIISNVFGMINHDELEAIASATLAAVHAVGSRNDLTDALIEQVKNQILFLDQRLNSLEANEAARILNIEGVSADVVSTVVRESLNELIAVRNKISAHVASGAGEENLLVAIEKLNDTAAAFSFAGNDYISQLISGVASAILSLVDNGKLSESGQLEIAARALVTIELYFSSLDDELTPDPNLLSESESALRKLGISANLVTPISRNELLAKFEEARLVVEQPALNSNPVLVETLELRPIFESVSGNPDLRNRKLFEELHNASLRLGMAAEIGNASTLAKLCKAIGGFAKAAPDLLADSSHTQSMLQNLARSSCELAIRCMDEYASKGVVSLFTKTIIDALQEVSGSEGVPENHVALLDVASERAGIDQSVEQRACPDGYDPVLMDLFHQEYEEQHERIMTYLAGTDLRVGEDIVLPIHTVNGISGSAKCFVVKAVFSVLEQRLNVLRAADRMLATVDVLALKDLLQELQVYQLEFPWSVETPLADSWVEIANAIGADHVDPDLTDLKLAHAQTSVQPALERNVYSELKIVEVTPEPHGGVPVQTRILEGEGAQAKSSHDPIVEYDLDMVSYYLDDAEEVLATLSSHQSSLLNNLADKELLKEIKRHMHTLKGAAGILKAESIESLSHYMESLFESIITGKIKPDEQCSDLLNIVISTLESMTADVRAERPYTNPSDLIAFVESCCEIDKIDMSKLYGRKDSESPAESGSRANDLHLDASLIAGELLEATTVTSSPELDQVIAESHADSIDAAAKPGMARNESGVASEAGQRTRRKQRGKRGRGNGNGKTQDVDGNITGIDAQPVTTVEADRAHEPIASIPSEEEQSTRETIAEIEQAAVLAHIPTAVSEKASVRFAGISDASDDNEHTVPHTNSSNVHSMLGRLQAHMEQQKKTKQRQVQSEKIKVDQRQLDNAVEQANELNASRHRQQAQYAEQMITLSALQEKLNLHLLNHNKFTASLRGYINRPNIAGLAQSDEDLQLERFNHLSAMHVQAGVEIEQMLQDCVDMVDQGRFINASYKQQAGLISSLQSDLLGSRLVPFQNIVVPLQKLIESASRATHKEVSSLITGADTIVDKILLEGIRDPLTHILKNAIDHGIESPNDRQNKGKPENGTITLTVQRRAKNVIITVTDDGRGIDPKVIREKAIEKGIISSDDDLTDREAMFLITTNGFSTNSSASRISGRGVGMDIVKAAVEKIGGLLKIESEVGVGTTFTMELPFTIGTNRAIVCQAGHQWFAIPSFTMTQLLSVDRTAVELQRSTVGHATIDYDGNQYDVIHLADLIAMPDLKSKSTTRLLQSTTLILCEQGDTRIAIEVDKGGSMPEIHIKKLDGVLSKLKGIIGETEIHDGEPVLVLDVMELVRLNLKRTGAGYEVRLNRIRSFRREEKPLALVVDDASSYRKLLSKHLESRGFAVKLARDGQDALDMMPMERVPDLVILDCEMPRVDGLTLCSALRARSDFKSVPVIMLTTKSGLENAAAQAGVNIYLTKPYDALALHEAIQSICPAAVTEPVK
jgi:chemotaxis protein histidine kinase CheA/CheY-like chemotaxis protein